uniref:J domain-containing protein n=1 Tax=Caenorhabditis japonica TaxID=281687 RepID=A0A8R1HS94_CAEJA
MYPVGGDSLETEDVINEHECQCDGCDRKRRQKAAHQPWRRTKKIIKFSVLVIAWAIFLLIVKKTTEIENTHKDYDPYQILGLDHGADEKAIKKAWRDMSKIHHPDRGGDAEYFDKIAKAHQALTDKEARENWDKYGNPDGPQATTFGIALPKWLVSKEYGLWVLAFYGLIFMVIMPTVVGIWWYNSIKYSVDKVLLDTTRLYYYFIHRTPRMEIGRMIAVLSGSFEFSKQYNAEVVERESDDIEVPRLMKMLTGVNDKGKEQPLSQSYALKARILMHAYLSRLPLESRDGALDKDQAYIVTRILRLIEEMTTCSQNLLAYQQVRIPIEMFDNLLRLQPMFVQALWQKNSPLLQLPHITDFHLQHLRKVLISFAFFRALQFIVRWYLFGKWTWPTFNFFGLRNRNNNQQERNECGNDQPEAQDLNEGRTEADPDPDSRDLSAIPPNKKWRISNECVSLIHSVISGLWAAYALLYYKDLVQDLLYFRCEAAINLILMSTGYLLHDLLDLLVNEQSARIIELLYHHVVVLGAFAVTMFFNRFLGVVVFGLLMELNSIFLHSRSLLNLYGVDKKNPSFRIIALLNMVTLFAFRLCVSAYLLYFAVNSISYIPWYQALINGVLILSLAITNSVLTYRLLAADGLLGTKRERRSPAATNVTNVESGPLTGEIVDDQDHHTIGVQTGSGTVPLVEDATQTVST